MLFSLALVACASSDPVPLPDAFESTDTPGKAVLDSVPMDTIVLPISIYIVDGRDGQSSSQRTAAQLEEVYDRAHESGHILGLHHTLVERDRLMILGTNGTRLTEEEIIVSRYVAAAMSDGLR